MWPLQSQWPSARMEQPPLHRWPPAGGGRARCGSCLQLLPSLSFLTQQQKHPFSWTGLASLQRCPERCQGSHLATHGPRGVVQPLGQQPHGQESGVCGPRGCSVGRCPHHSEGRCSPALGPPAAPCSESSPQPHQDIASLRQAGFACCSPWGRSLSLWISSTLHLARHPQAG